MPCFASNTVEQATDGNSTIKVGTLTALTGYAAKQGVVCKKAFEIAIAEHKPQIESKSNRVELVFGDSQRKAAPAISEFTHMTSNNSIVAVALSGSPVGMGINPFSKRTKTPIIGAVGHKDFLTDNDYAFAVWPSTASEGAAMANKIAVDRKERVAIISAEDDWTLSLRDGLVEALKKHKIAVVYNEEVSREEQDFSSILLRMRSKQPDAVFVNVVLGNSGVLIKKIRELGIDATLYANYFAGTEAEIKVAGPAAEGLVGAKVDYDINALKSLFVKHQMPEADPNTIAYTCFASMRFLLETIDTIPNDATAETLYQAMLGMKSIQVLGAPMPFDARRAGFTFRYEISKNGKWVAN